MGLETATYIGDLVSTNPLSGDFKSEGDDHLRLLKATLQATFPGLLGAAWRVQNKVGYTVVAGDNMTLIRSTGAGTIALTAAATLGNKHMFAYFNNHSATIVIDPNAAELINGAATLNVEPNNGVLVFCSGTAFYALHLPLTSAFMAAVLAAATGAAARAAFGATALGDALFIAASAAAARTTLELVGKETIFLPASSWIARTTNGPAFSLIELATNDVMLQTLDFDQTTSEGAQFMLLMPKSWNESTITFKVVWTAASGAGTVTWNLSAFAASDDDALDTAFGTAVGVTDTLIAANDAHITAESAAVTIAGTPAEGDMVILQIARDIVDTLTADAKLIGVHIYITTNAAIDA